MFIINILLNQLSLIITINLNCTQYFERQCTYIHRWLAVKSARHLQSIPLLRLHLRRPPTPRNYAVGRSVRQACGTKCKSWANFCGDLDKKEMREEQRQQDGSGKRAGCGQRVPTGRGRGQMKRMKKECMHTHTHTHTSGWIEKTIHLIKVEDELKLTNRS